MKKNGKKHLMAQSYTLQKASGAVFYFSRFMKLPRVGATFVPSLPALRYQSFVIFQFALFCKTADTNLSTVSSALIVGSKLASTAFRFFSSAVPML